MSDYNKYITAVNKIFDYISKMKAGWTGLDNLNYIESIEEYKNAVTSNVDAFKKPGTKELEKEPKDNKENNKEEKEKSELEALGE